MHESLTVETESQFGASHMQGLLRTQHELPTGHRLPSMHNTRLIY